MQIGILEAKDFSTRVINDLSSVGKVKIFQNDKLDIFLKDTEVLFIRLKYFIDKDFLTLCKKLKYICTPTTGLNHIDLSECKKRDIKIISIKNETDFLFTIRATPEHTFGLVLSLLRNYKNAFLSKENSLWDRERYKGYELYENSIGIIGFGRVGKILSKYFKVFSSKVYFYDIDDSIKEIENAKRLNSIEELIKTTNIIILSASYNNSSYQFFNKTYIDMLEKKYFINTARGELIDEDYLLEKIKEDYFCGVALDVIQNEQLNNNLDRFLELQKNKNLIITPHISGATYNSMHKTEEFVFEKLKEVLK